MGAAYPCRGRHLPAAGRGASTCRGSAARSPAFGRTGRSCRRSRAPALHRRRRAAGRTRRSVSERMRGYAVRSAAPRSDPRSRPRSRTQGEGVRTVRPPTSYARCVDRGRGACRTCRSVVNGSLGSHLGSSISARTSDATATRKASSPRQLRRYAVTAAVTSRGVTSAGGCLSPNCSNGSATRHRLSVSQSPRGTPIGRGIESRRTGRFRARDRRTGLRPVRQRCREGAPT